MEITTEQVRKIFELASIEYNKEENYTIKDISEALIEIEKKIYSFNVDIKTEAITDKKILIADDLELSIYQLSTMLKKIGIIPSIARKKEEALAEMMKKSFDCIIIDLFLPDSSDGFELIKTAVEYKNNSNKNLKIIVISGTDDKSLIEQCYEKGADLYIPKSENWHTDILKYFSTIFKTIKNQNYTKYTIKNNIASFVCQRFNDAKIFDAITKDINFAIYSGQINIVLDLSDIMSFDLDNTYIFADIYKLCAENKGLLVLINPSQKIREALNYAYLEGTIPHTNTIEEAVSLIQSN